LVSDVFNLPRGMKDTEAEEMNRRLWLYERIREVVRRYGFQLVEPTPIESLKTLEAKSGPAIRDQIYWFEDKAGRGLGLRFDLTVGLSRMVAGRSDIPEPIKFAAIGGNWRYEEPQFGRYRYFTQWDVEIFGSASPLADAEAICVGADILTNVGLNEYVIRVGNRKLSEAYLRQLEISSQDQLERSLRIIDKIRKETRQQLENEFKALGISDSTINEIFSYISLNGPASKVLEKLSSFTLKDPLAQKGVEELTILADALSAADRSDSCIFDLSIVRGIGYYDGIVFEGFDKGGEDVGSIFGGGRYDKLCKVYGKRDIPATGVAGGIERLMISLERANLFPKTRQAAQVFIATVQEGLRNEAVRLAQKLRNGGISTEIDLKGRSLGKQMDYADSMQIPYLIVIGPKELESKIVRVRSMANRQETEVPLANLVEKMRALS
jgi:histidyl-tRNA synthetase